MAETVMRPIILALTIYLTHALALSPHQPQQPKGCITVTYVAYFLHPLSVTERATFSATKAREVLLQQRLKRNIFDNIFRTEAAAKFIKLGVSASPRGSQNGNRRKRKRIRRVVYRKPPTVYVLPDVIQPMTQAEGERVLRWGAWVTWF